MTITRASGLGRMILAEREARRLNAYRDSVGVWTIGIGHTSAAGAPVVKPGMTITKAEADAIFARDLRQFERAVELATAGCPHALKQHQFDALVSLAFNIGVPRFVRSTLARLIREGDMVGAAEQFLVWRKPAEVLTRRYGEHAQFLGHRLSARLDAPVPSIFVDAAAAAAAPDPLPSSSPTPTPSPLARLTAWFQGQPA